MFFSDTNFMLESAINLGQGYFPGVVDNFIITRIIIIFIVAILKTYLQEDISHDKRKADV